MAVCGSELSIIFFLLSSNMMNFVLLALLLIVSPNVFLLLFFACFIARQNFASNLTAIKELTGAGMFCQ